MITPWQLLAYIFAGWLMVLGTGWVVFVVISRRKALQASIELRRLGVEKGLRLQEKALGAMGEGEGRIPGDEEEAALEERARRRMRGR